MAKSGSAYEHRCVSSGSNAESQGRLPWEINYLGSMSGSCTIFVYRMG